MFRSVHVEANAIIAAPREQMLGATLYMVCTNPEDGAVMPGTTSCMMCKKLVINAVIEKNGKDVCIVWAYGMMTTNNLDFVKKAVEEIAGDNNRIRFCDLSAALNNGGQGNHPDINGNIKAAEILSSFISEKVIPLIPEKPVCAPGDINGDGKISYCLFKGEQGNAEAEARTRYAVEDANKILKEAGLQELVFYDKNNKNGYLLDQNGTWSNAAANNHMKTILSAYSEKAGNMVELVIANNDEMALGAISALNELGYNKEGGKTIPVFGIDATEAAKAKIRSGAMTGTVKQDAEGMAMAIAKIAENFMLGRAPFEEIAEIKLAGESQRIGNVCNWF
jgi:hypothetical protein